MCKKEEKLKFTEPQIEEVKTHEIEDLYAFSAMQGENMKLEGGGGGY